MQLRNEGNINIGNKASRDLDFQWSHGALPQQTHSKMFMNFNVTTLVQKLFLVVHFKY